MKQYYYSDGKNQFGPFSKIELQNTGISKETLVWFEGLSEWQKAGDIEDLADLFPKKQTPPPLPNQKSTIPQPLISNEMTVVRPQQKKRSKKKVIIWCCSILLFVVILAVISNELYEKKQFERFEQTIRNEKNNPKQYLFKENKHLESNYLKGTIQNISGHTTYKQINIAFSYYDYEGKVIQTDLYTINGSCHSGSSLPFDVKIRKPQGLSNCINWDKWSVEIIGAETF